MSLREDRPTETDIDAVANYLTLRGDGVEITSVVRREAEELLSLVFGERGTLDV
jgi:hypothetical protein